MSKLNLSLAFVVLVAGMNLVVSAGLIFPPAPDQTECRHPACAPIE